MKINLIFCFISVLVFLLSVFLCFFKGSNEEKSNRMPIVFIGGLYVIGEIYFTFKYLRYIPIGLSNYNIILQCIAFIAVIVTIFALSMSNKYIKHIDKKEKDKMSDFMNIRDQIKIEAALAKDVNSKKLIEELANKIYLEDPISCDDVKEINNTILNLIKGMGYGNYQAISEIDKQVRELLNIRRIKNKK